MIYIAILQIVLPLSLTAFSLVACIFASTYELIYFALGFTQAGICLYGFPVMKTGFKRLLFGGSSELPEAVVKQALKQVRDKTRRNKEDSLDE